MALIEFDQNKPMDIVLIGRAAIDFNPNEIHRTLDKVRTFTMYVGGSPANIAVGVNKLGKKDSNVIEFVLLKRVGDKISEIRNSLDRIGYVITQGNTREEAVRFCEQAVEKIQFEME